MHESGPTSRHKGIFKILALKADRVKYFWEYLSEKNIDTAWAKIRTKSFFINQVDNAQAGLWYKNCLAFNIYCKYNKL